MDSGCTRNEELIQEKIREYERRAKEEHALLVQSKRELGYLKKLKRGQLPVKDGRLVPDEPGGIVYNAERKAELAEYRAKRQAKIAAEEETPSLSEDRIQANKLWVNGIRTGEIAPKPLTLASSLGRCADCYKPLTPATHDRCHCWECDWEGSKPGRKLVTRERYNPLIKDHLWGLPERNCTCVPNPKGMPDRCEDCRWWGSVKTFPKKYRKLHIDPGHNIDGKLAPGRECLCKDCRLQDRYQASLGRCVQCVQSSEWKRQQHCSGGFNARSENPYREEQIRTDKEVLDYLRSNANFCYRSNTRRALDPGIKREVVIIPAKESFLGCDVVLQQLSYEPTAIQLQPHDHIEAEYLFAGEKEKEALDHKVAYRYDHREELLDLVAPYEYPKSRGRK